MNLFVVALIVFAVVCQIEVTFSEWNMLYHFEALPQQYPYLDRADVTHEGRIADTVRVLNEIRADVNCIVDWNGNGQSQYYLSSPASLVKRLNERLVNAQADFGPDPELVKFIQEIQGMAKKIDTAKWDVSKISAKVVEKIKNPGKITDQKSLNFLVELRDRTITIQASKDIYFYQKPNDWEIKIVRRSSGTVVNVNGETVKTIPEVMASTPDQRIGAVAVVYNKVKMEHAPGEKTQIITLEPAGDGTPFVSNFIVQPLILKNSEVRIDMICTHLKSGYNSFIERKNLARSISDFVRREREKGSRANFLLMGDMNAEVSEIAYDLGAQIVRYDTQTVLPDKEFIQETIFSPASQIAEIQLRKEHEDRRLLAYQNYIREIIQLKNSLNDASDLSSPKSDLDAVEQDIKKLEKEPSLPIWLELSNFVTERRVDIHQADFQDAEYQQHVKSLLTANPDLKSKIEAATLKLEAQQKIKRAESECPQFREAMEEAHEKDLMIFSKIMAHFFSIAPGKEFGKEDKIKYKKFKFDKTKTYAVNKDNVGFYWQLIVESLLEDGKTDYILANLYNRMDIVEIKSNAQYNLDIAMGVPNKTFPSHHLPIFARVKFQRELFSRREMIKSTIETLTVVNSNYVFSTTSRSKRAII